MKRALSPGEDCCTTLTHHQERLSYSPEHEALLAAFPAAEAQAASDPLSDGDEDGSAEVEADEGQLRRWKSEQANKALWDFGGKIKRVQQDWRRLQEELRVATPNKRARTDAAPGTYSGPLLLLNQLYWEQNMGASISSITGDNMFGINMFGSYSSICAQMLRGSSSPAAAAAAAANSRAAPSNSSSNGQQQQQGSTLTGPDRGCMTNAAVVKQQYSGGLATLARKNPDQQQDCHHHQQQQQQQWEEVVGETDDSSPHTPSSNNNRDPLLPTLPDAAAAAVPAAAPTAAAVQQQQPFDLEEIEAVCRAQGLSHLPASRRFVRALRIIKAAKQQQQSVALEQQPALPLVAVV